MRVNVLFICILGIGLGDGLGAAASGQAQLCCGESKPIGAKKP